MNRSVLETTKFALLGGILSTIFLEILVYSVDLSTSNNCLSNWTIPLIMPLLLVLWICVAIEGITMLICFGEDDVYAYLSNDLIGLVIGGYIGISVLEVQFLLRLETNPQQR